MLFFPPDSAPKTPGFKLDPALKILSVPDLIPSL